MLLRAAAETQGASGSCLLGEPRMNFKDVNDQTRESVMAISATCLRTGSGNVRGAVCSLACRVLLLRLREVDC